MYGILSVTTLFSVSDVLSFNDYRFRKEDEWHPMGGSSHTSPHQSGPLRSDICSCMPSLGGVMTNLWHGHGFWVLLSWCVDGSD